MLFFKTNAKTICCLLLALTLATVTIARQTEPSTTFIEESNNVNHKINGYKYLCMANQGNQYDKTAATWEDLEIINTKIKYLDQYNAIQKDLESTVIFLKENLNERVKAIEG